MRNSRGNEPWIKPKSASGMADGMIVTPKLIDGVANGLIFEP
jgi:hypothetical protein